MFFFVSKLVWFALSPVNLLILLAALAALLAFTRFARFGRRLGLLAILGLVLLAFSPLPRIIVRPLEDRFPQQDAAKGPVAGIIVLGGAVSMLRGEATLNDKATRMTKAVELARLHPQAKLVFTGGGENPLSSSGMTETDGARKLFAELGLPPERLIFEDKSRNTRENAAFTRRLVDPKPGERWLLVTSAWHMPRSMGVFRKAGFHVEAFPVDYLTSGETTDFVLPYREAARGLDIAKDGTKEWVGLLAYWAMGYTDALYPGP
ncbi:YdcF family protein [Bosea caraganae]|uniref:YdcF family protein n=1 Tax=Bosea caraganae TaxID=2763117 RepID=A0A370LCD3_9HYPH|nr:YdcF family protein [Bosea caraganae]RDJ27556.1 YdcF family protein [Bosea caraganae]RDJ29571.1 YdcF family protein [Bosea caraganae]